VTDSAAVGAQTEAAEFPQAEQEPERGAVVAVLAACRGRALVAEQGVVAGARSGQEGDRQVWEAWKAPHGRRKSLADFVAGGVARAA
jgi:hypothetical protein